MPPSILRALPLLVGAALFAPAPADMPGSPADIYGDLFRAVQARRVFPDGKTFADAVPRRAAEGVMAAYRTEQPRTDAELRAFVLANFVVPGVNDHPRPDLRAHIRELWPRLARQPVTAAPGSSQLSVAEPFVVPGGRFREMYYWDSYFTMLGLRADGERPLVESMIADFTAAIERYGHVPNGMRTYYLSRSQPPFYALMLDLSDDRDPAVSARRLAALKQEYAFWMRGASCIGEDGACARVVRMPDGALLNRYWDDRDTPRDESYAEDAATAAGAVGRAPATVLRSLRAAAESGWDFSSRWLADPARLASIRTVDIVPVDLNSLLLAMEERLALRSKAAGDVVGARRFAAAAERRRRGIDRWLWLPEEGRYADWDRAAHRATPNLTAATLYPLFVGAASPAQAEAVAATTRHTLLASGGLRTTSLRTGQQWDAPNGWAPLQWIAIDGFARYGQTALAEEIARRWMATVQTAFGETGKMLEKYDVEERKPGGGGEYATQDGFGWTNGVSSALLDRYPGLLASSVDVNSKARPD